MTISFNTLDPNTNTFGDWLFRTNDILDALANVVVTVDSQNPPSGNVVITGTFESNALFVSSISGGTIGSPDILTFETATSFSANTAFLGSTNILGSVGNYVVSGANSTHFILAANTASGRLRFAQIDLTSVDATALTSGIISPARIAGNYPGITGVGTLTSGSIAPNFGNVNIGANVFTGNGSGLTDLNGSNITTGTIASTRLGLGSANTATFLRGDGQWAIPVGNTNLSSSSTSTTATVSSSTGSPTNLPVANTSTTGVVTAVDQSFGGNKTFTGNVNVNGNLTANKFFGDGEGITNISATVLVRGVIPPARILGTYSGVQFLALNGSSSQPAYAFGSAPGSGMFFIDADNVGLSVKGSNRASLNSQGNLTAQGNVSAFSDRKLKKDIKTLNNALDMVCKLRGVSFTRIDTEQKSIGVIAQEMQEHIPEVVHTDHEGTLSVSYGNLAGFFIEAIKELKKENEELRERLIALENK